MTTMKEIADKAKVSRATVSRVLSGSEKVKPETKERVQYWIEKLDFQPNLVAQGLVGNKTKVIGVMVPNLSNPFYANIVEAIETEAAELGYSIIIQCTHKDTKREKKLLRVLKSRRADGLLIIPSDKEDNYNYLKNIDMPMVVFTKEIENVSCVYVSIKKEVKKIVNYFYESGHKNLCYVGPVKKKNGTYNIKYDSYVSAIEALDITLCDIIDCPQGEDEEDAIVYDTVLEYLQSNQMKSTAVFAHNDIAAVDTIAALERKEYKVPEDIAVFGFDNTILAMKSNPRLSSVKHPLNQIGVYALKLLISKIENGEEECIHLEVDSTLIERDSTKCTRKQ